MNLDELLLEVLAGAAHEVFCEGMRSRGYRYGPRTDERLKTHAALVPYADLPQEFKRASRLNVRDIPAKLAAAGYAMSPARGNEPPFEFPVDSLEHLAELEHERWVQSRLDDGWVYAARTDLARKRHNCLVPWAELSEAEREKDRDLVRGIPKILARAGYEIVQVGNWPIHQAQF